MLWPSPDQFNEAVQSPQQVFGDKDLRFGQLVCNELGLPKVATGAFASVYQIKTDNGDFAVRCFLSDNSRRRERYRKISEAILNDKLASTVDFSFIDEGIRLDGRWYPILKMQWVNGISLTEYVAAHLDDVNALISLADKFRAMVAGLRSEGIAHGDLQHGNIIVCGDELRLVDYDGMFVPALTGEESDELGHANFQHPARSREHFGDYLDHFSSWMIYLGLHCLVHDPKLWTEFNGGDEKLLLGRADYARPFESKLIDRLRSHENADIRWCGQKILDAIYTEPERLSPIDQGLRLSSGARVRQNLKRFQSKVIDWGKARFFVDKTPEGTRQEKVSSSRIPSYAHWQTLSDKEKRSYGLEYIDSAQVLKILHGRSSNPRFLTAVNLAVMMVSEDESQAIVYCRALLAALKWHSKSGQFTVLQQKFQTAIAGCSRYCLTCVPAWLECIYLEGLEQLVKQSAQQSRVHMVDLTAFLRVWFVLPDQDSSTIEDLLVSIVANPRLSDDHRVRGIFAIRQLFELYQLRRVDQDVRERFIAKINRLRQRALGWKNQSVYLRMMMDSMMSMSN
ncbi:MAG: hypothetical protein K2W95_23870 [Candidatus Obscuribacterales bacterium]|nr:hypothetical protein [Candidatus Obscuribacterales bacterium]